MTHVKTHESTSNIIFSLNIQCGENYTIRVIMDASLVKLSILLLNI